MKLRNARVEDAASFREIYNYYIEKTTISFETEPLSVPDWQQRILEVTADGCPCIVCEDEGRVVGYAYAHRWKARASYKHTAETSVYVAHNLTGRGYGSCLMQELIKQCRAVGLHALIACITSPNEPSFRLHERLGFRRASEFKEVGRKFNRWLDVVDYQLCL